LTGPAYAAAMPKLIPHPTDRPPPEAPYRPGWVPRRPLPGDGAGPPGQAVGPGLEAGPARPAWALPAALAAMAVVYPAAFSFQVVPFWSAMVALSAFTWWAAWHPYLRTRLRPTRQLVAMGLVSGLGLYLCFGAAALVVQATPLWPWVEQVSDLTRATAPGALAALVIVFATSPSEEVLWRGAVFARLTRRYGPGWRPLVATTVLYALFVGLSGSPILPLAALVCGTVWGRQRQVTGSIVPSLVSHVLWALLMFLYIPGLNGP
jgi:membrane protease YdiL (CAAX protease family)